MYDQPVFSVGRQHRQTAHLVLPNFYGRTACGGHASSTVVAMGRPLRNVTAREALPYVDCQRCRSMAPLRHIR